MRTTTRVAALAASGLALLAIAAPAEAVRGVTQSSGKPADYFQTKGLTQSRFTADQLERTVVRLPAYDGAELYIEVTKPKGETGLPVVLEASPYHGTLADREGTRILPGPVGADGKKLGLTGYFARRGYAVVMMDLRGTGRSRGCLDHLGLKDARDLKQVVEWAASQPWSNGRVGMTGHSYVGSTPMVAAAQRPKGLKTIVPSAGLAAMYDHQFQAGVPYFLQYAGPMALYPALAAGRKSPVARSGLPQIGAIGDDAGNNPEEAACAAGTTALLAGEDQLSGRYADWHAQRDWSAGAADADIPVFLFHGVNDNAARITAAQWFFERGGRKDDKAWIGQWNHDSVNHRKDQWTAALHAWFDKHLAQRDVDTGPAVEAFLSGGTFESGRTGDREEVLTAKSIGDEDAPSMTFRTSGTALTYSCGFTCATPGSRTFQGSATSTGVEYSTGPLPFDLVLAGVPEMVLSASVTAPRVHLIATLYEKSARTNQRRITQCSINPELRHGIATRSVVTPGTRYDMAPPCMAMAHHVKKGSELVLRVATQDPDKVPTFAADPQVTVFNGPAPNGTSITVPVVERPALHADDVELEDPRNGTEG